MNMRFTRQEIEAFLDALSIQVARGYYLDRDPTGRKEKTALAAMDKLEWMIDRCKTLEIEITSAV